MSCQHGQTHVPLTLINMIILLVYLIIIDTTTFGKGAKRTKHTF
jgi:hypothetical protein